MRVAFHIDGLEDTNHLYRKNVLWHQLIENVSAFINAGGRAGWNMIIFKHNEHQVEEARQLSEKMGFSNFSTHYSARWINRNWVHAGQVDKKERWDAGGYFIEPPVFQPKSGIVNSVIRVFDHQHPINCKVFTDKKVEIYIRANGQVQPCCEVGEVAVHELGELVDNPEDINLHYHSLNDILQGLFFKKIADGISGGPTRLQNCFYHCGHGQDKNYT